MAKLVTVIISPVDDCNMACRYCIHPKQRTGSRMSLETLENSIIKVSEYSHRIGRSAKFIWHGGEPLLATIDFYKAVVELTTNLEKKGYAIKHAMQSNATLLTWTDAEFFVKNGFHLSFSLDGPINLNDKTRVYPDGKSTFNDALKGILAYKAISGHVSTICVLSAGNIKNIDELYEFYKLQGLFSQFNPWFYTPGSLIELKINPLQYREAIIKLFRLWFFEEDQQSWGENNTMEEYLNMCLRGVSTSCIFRENCQSDEFYSIDSFGMIGPCSRFFGNPEFHFGNINKIKLFDEIVTSNKRRMLQGRNKVLTDCKRCDIHLTCNSGCMHHSYSQFGTVFRKDPLCSAYQAIFTDIKKMTNDALAQAQKEAVHE